MERLDRLNRQQLAVVGTICMLVGVALIGLASVLVQAGAPGYYIAFAFVLIAALALLAASIYIYKRARERGV